MTRTSLAQLLAQEVSQWKSTGFLSNVPEVSEILAFQSHEDGSLRFLRKAQLSAIETYLYLRICKNTAHTYDIYRELCGDKLLEALHIPLDNADITSIALKGGQEAILETIRNDDDFVKKYSLEAVREMMDLQYSSYILALAMGAGKTTLIGAIIAIEFALAIETTDDRFLKNALVFARGTTIFRALREIQALPFEKILPPRFYKKFITSVRFVIANESKELPILEGSNFHIIISNTEKIRIQKQTARGKKQQSSVFSQKQDEEITQEANRRLQKIATLQNLGIFSDEAHGVYGQKMGQDLKRVRQTVNYLAEASNVKVVVSTTGTPYFERQMLKEVVYWYGIAEGIEDGILKSVKNSIRAYRQVNDEGFLRAIIEDFCKEYGNVHTPDGTPAKLAIYLPRTEDVKESRPIIEQTLIAEGYDASLVTECHSKATNEYHNAFENFHRKDSPHRIILLVGMGTEGWDCPPLFACALAREIKGSNNLILQASTRCLRQISGNTQPARIYLSEKNVKPLDRQFQETYGHTLNDLVKIMPLKTTKIILRKMDIPPISFEIERMFVREKSGCVKHTTLSLSRFPRQKETYTTVVLDSVMTREGKGSLRETSATEQETEVLRLPLREVASTLARRYDMSFFTILTELEKIHDDLDFTEEETEIIASQIEKSLGDRFEIEVRKERQELALIKKEGFSQDEHGNYFAEIRYSEDSRLLEYAGEKKGFHYSPYNFDSQDEKAFFEWLLEALGVDAKQVEDIYFTGAITAPEKTDFWFWYKGIDNLWHRYTPDFLIRRTDGKVCIVEIKPLGDESSNLITQNKAKKLRRIAELNPDTVRFELVEGFERLSATPVTDAIRTFLHTSL